MTGLRLAPRSALSGYLSPPPFPPDDLHVGLRGGGGDGAMDAAGGAGAGKGET